QKGIRCILDQFRSASADIDDGRRIQIEGPIDFSEDFARTIVITADHNAIGMLEILNCRTLPQKFRIRCHLDIGIRTFLTQNVLVLLTGADGHGRLGGYDGSAAEQRRVLAYCLIDEAQVSMTVAATRWRANRDKDRLSLPDSRNLGGEFKSPLPHVLFDQ